LTKALSVKPSLPPAVREVAILVTRTSGLRMNFMRMLSPRRIAY
jgi:hypothetical protein